MVTASLRMFSVNSRCSAAILCRGAPHLSTWWLQDTCGVLTLPSGRCTFVCTVQLSGCKPLCSKSPMQLADERSIMLSMLGIVDRGTQAAVGTMSDGGGSSSCLGCAPAESSKQCTRQGAAASRGATTSLSTAEARAIAQLGGSARCHRTSHAISYEAGLLVAAASMSHLLFARLDLRLLEPIRQWRSTREWPTLRLAMASSGRRWR